MASVSKDKSNGVLWKDHLKDYFEIIEDVGKNVKTECVLCRPKKTVLSTSKISPANLLKHVEVRTQLTFEFVV